MLLGGLYGLLFVAFVVVRYTKAAITPVAELIMMSSTERIIRTCTINDVEIARTKTEVKPTAFCVSADGRFVVQGDENGDVIIRTSWNLNTIFRYKLASSAVSSLAFAVDETAILAGLRDGKLAAYVFDKEMIKTHAKMTGLKEGHSLSWYQP